MIEKSTVVKTAHKGKMIYMPGETGELFLLKEGLVRLYRLSAEGPTRISESVTWMKATMLAFEAVAIWALAELLVSFGFSRQRVLIYAWHPLTVWEFAGSGHVDAAAIAFILLALLARHRNASLLGITLACATLVKLFPVVLFPALYRRWGWKMPVAFAITVTVAYLPYLSVGPAAVLGFLPGYVTEQGLASGGNSIS
ncbi:MAG: DUF2029 domain-containing protein [Pyrinomonadaceae bacterium]|nr:DUF2029 domain-containing protein [Pyrinomonadaceae bacterium]